MSPDEAPGKLRTVTRRLVWSECRLDGCKCVKSEGFLLHFLEERTDLKAKGSFHMIELLTSVSVPKQFTIGRY